MTRPAVGDSQRADGCCRLSGEREIETEKQRDQVTFTNDGTGMQIQTLKLPITRIFPLNNQPALLPLALAKVVTWPSDKYPSCPESNLSCVVEPLSCV